MQTTILMYHMIADPLDQSEASLCRTPNAFRQDLLQIRQSGYQVVSLESILDCIAGKHDLPEKTVAITFDDGLACIYENALPILQEFRYPSSLFIVSGCVNGFNEWGKNFNLPRRRMLKSNEIRTLSELGVNIGAHTVNHVWLGRSKKDVATKEIHDSKAALEDILGQEVSTFAYPFGNWNPMVRDAVIDAGYTGACSTMPGRNKKNTDPFLLRRAEIKGDDALWKVRLKLRFATSDMPPRPPVRSTLRKLFSKKTHESV